MRHVFSILKTPLMRKYYSTLRLDKFKERGDKNRFSEHWLCKRAH